ncbi:hypothetical protein F4801DRAFT_604445 [Xylaria longipes]|nr:hypothetical protein F4801DRAFT_604445 [Xylaria longipes]
MEGAPNVAQAFEPFFDFDAVAEAGEAMEKRIFGGRYSIYPETNTIPISTALSHWPHAFAGRLRDPKHRVFQDGSLLVSEICPPLYIAKYFSSEFWDDPLPPKKSDAEFSRIKFLRSITLFSTTDRIVWNDMEVDERGKEQWNRLDQAVVQALRHRQDEVNSYRRDWYDSHAQRWVTTPWAMGLYFRERLDVFAQGFQDRDECLCNATPAVFIVGAEGLAKMNWSDPDEFFSRMPVATRIDNAWVHFTIGLLMLAAMPVRTVDFLEKTPEASRRVTFTESLQASITRKLRVGPKEIATVHMELPKSGNRRRWANVLHNPFNQNGTAVQNPTQLNYLDLVDNILENIIQARAIVSGPWYREIQKLSQDLREQRNELIFKYPLRHTIRWATRWEFRVPDYDPENLDWIQWDEPNQSWRHYATAAPPSELSPPPSDMSLDSPPASDMSLDISLSSSSSLPEL